jgi:putative hydrolase
MEKAGWSFTALYYNTARAHKLGKTKDWVVMYFERIGYEDQATVVMERCGPLSGKRVVRGREQACKRYYRSRA